jgi:hypothetical protein
MVQKVKLSLCLINNTSWRAKYSDLEVWVHHFYHNILWWESGNIHDFGTH